MPAEPVPAPTPAPDRGDAGAARTGLPLPRRIALGHHWLVSQRGGERVLAEIAALLPGAELFTLVRDPAVPLPPGIPTCHASALRRLPGAQRLFRPLAPWHAGLYAGFDLSGFGLVVSSDAGLAKALRAPPGVPHLCYCYSPPRWAWDLAETYLAGQPALLRPIARRLLARVRATDRIAAQGVTRFVACSRHVAERIRRSYDRPADVVHPPADTDWFTPAADGDRNAGIDPHDRDRRPYLLLGEAAPYKRFEAGLAACGALGRPLVVAGPGRALRRLVPLALPGTRFVPDPDDAGVRDLYRSARALLFPGEEDFGLVPVEAMACGTPVIALARGGACETVVDGATGVLYPAATGASPPGEVEALVAGIERFESLEPRLAPGACRERALDFGRERFRAGLRCQLQAVLADRNAGSRGTQPPLALRQDPR